MSRSPVVRHRPSSLVVLALAVGCALAVVLGHSTPCFAAIVLEDAPRFIGEELEEWEDTSGGASAEEALAHPYLEAYHDPDDEPGAPRLEVSVYKKSQIFNSHKKKLFFQELFS